MFESVMIVIAALLVLVLINVVAEPVIIGIAALSVLVLVIVLTKRALEGSERRLDEDNLIRRRLASGSSGMFCHQCRYENPQYAEYCARCGMHLMKEFLSKQ